MFVCLFVDLRIKMDAKLLKMKEGGENNTDEMIGIQKTCRAGISSSSYRVGRCEITGRYPV